MIEKLTQITGNNSEENILYLDPKERTKARIVAKQIWIESLRLLNGRDYCARQIEDAMWASVAIKRIPASDFTRLKDMDLIIGRDGAKSAEDFVSEEYSFCTDGEVVVIEKHTDSLKGKTTTKLLEADKARLEDLFQSIKESKELTSSLASG